MMIPLGVYNKYECLGCMGTLVMLNEVYFSTPQFPPKQSRATEESSLQWCCCLPNKAFLHEPGGMCEGNALTGHPL